MSQRTPGPFRKLDAVAVLMARLLPAPRTGPAAPKAGLGLDRAAPACGGQRGAGGARADRVRPRLHGPSVARHPGRLAPPRRASRGSSPRRYRPAQSPGPSSTGLSPSPARSAPPAPPSRSSCTSTSGSAAVSSSRRSPSRLRAADIGLEFLTGDLQGSARPIRRGVHRPGRAVGDGARVHPRSHPGGPRVGPRPGQVDRRRGRHRRCDARRGASPPGPGDEPASTSPPGSSSPPARRKVSTRRRRP